MIAPILTFLSTRIVYVFVSVVVVVAAVPTIVAIHGNTITITTVASSSRHGEVASAGRHKGDDARTRLVIQVKTAGDDAIVKLNTEEVSCDAQIAQLASVSTLSSTATTAAIERGKSEFHNNEQPFISEIKADEDEIAQMKVVSSTTVQTFLLRIQTIETTALGDDGHHQSAGSLLTVCESIIVEIRTIVVVVQAPQPPSGGGGEGDDIKPKI
ncbi:MAG TPA: hypothetical protein VGG90_02700 [Candidatus Dormibacteraeota bacterium]